ncbi:50S ribosomal protein L4 [Candidatus Nomurabacteria bacterium]|nr:50S ribosomal protein L4 [Candidatus Nomurabacteria bacterium]
MAETSKTTKKASAKPLTKEKAEKVVQKAQEKRKTAPSLEATIYSQKGSKSGSIALPSALFGLTWNNALVHQVINGMLANKRAGTAHTKDRGEVSGGGKKPWKQKGTGRARHGSSRSPVWVGGGVTHGPRSDKDYSQKINKKMSTKALFTILSRKYADGKVLFVESLVFGGPKTKDAAATLSALASVEGFEKIASKKPTAVLIAVPKKTDGLVKSFANLPGVTLIETKDFSALSTFVANHILIADPSAALEVLGAKSA